MNAEVDTRLAHRSLRVLVIAAGIGTSIVFIVVGLSSELQMFGDGSIFSYAVAAQDAWSFHWHNISGRLFTFAFVYGPAEAYVGLTKSAKGGIAVSGLLFFSAQLLGLVVTLMADRTTGRVIFSYACLSTACLCPLVFGAPTEMWIAHAVFWPTLAVCLCAPANPHGAAFVFVALLALVFTHEGAIVFAGTILLALFLRDWRDAIFVRAFCAFCAAMTIWLIVKITMRPDNYIAGVLAAAAYKFIDVRNLAQPVFLLLLFALAGYGVAVVVLQRLHPARARLYAILVCAVVLAVYWVWFDRSLLTEARYNLRTVLLIMTPVFGILAVVYAMQDGERRRSPFPFLAQMALAAENSLNPRSIAGAILLTMLVYAVETAKFVWVWTEYKVAVRTLAIGSDSDPALGNAQFVSSRRIGADLNRLSWNSTTPYLSALVAPGLAPARLVVDPGAAYFWLSCETAARSEQTSTAIPAESRRLIRLYACLHRPRG
ncbi:MAG TPA: hypothetical protein VGF53_03480 [Pseudolabrys sp.]|jgi:hypothetical protein